MLEEAAVFFEDVREGGGLIAAQSGGEDEVMGALDGADGVNLHEAHALDQTGDVFWSGGGVLRIIRQGLALKEQMLRDGGGDDAIG